MSWKRLIRFVAAETLRIHIGQPVEPALDVGLAIHNKKVVQAYEIVGSALDPNAKVTDRVLTVEVLLEPLSRDQVKLVRCLGLNYSDHAEEMKLEKPPVPAVFYKPVTALIGPGAPIIIPLAAQPVEYHSPDYEVELTVVIGKPAKDVAEGDALDYVLGYTVGNDVTFRHYQMETSQWTFGKSLDDSTPFGPVLVSAKELPDPQNLPLRTELNGKIMQDGVTSNQIFSVKQAIAFLSRGTTLEPGCLIMTGTPAGVGYFRKPSVYLKGGDELRLSIGGIGTLINRVVEESKARL